MAERKLTIDNPKFKNKMKNLGKCTGKAQKVSNNIFCVTLVNFGGECRGGTTDVKKEICLTQIPVKVISSRARTPIFASMPESTS